MGFEAEFFSGDLDAVGIAAAFFFLPPDHISLARTMKKKREKEKPKIKNGKKRKKMEEKMLYRATVDLIIKLITST